MIQLPIIVQEAPIVRMTNSVLVGTMKFTLDQFDAFFTASKAAPRAAVGTTKVAASRVAALLPTRERAAILPTRALAAAALTPPSLPTPAPEAAEPHPAPTTRTIVRIDFKPDTSPT